MILQRFKVWGVEGLGTVRPRGLKRGMRFGFGGRTTLVIRTSSSVSLGFLTMKSKGRMPRHEHILLVLVRLGKYVDK